MILLHFDQGLFLRALSKIDTPMLLSSTPWYSVKYLLSPLFLSCNVCIAMLDFRIYPLLEFLELTLPLPLIVNFSIGKFFDFVRYFEGWRTVFEVFNPQIENYSNFLVFLEAQNIFFASRFYRELEHHSF